MHEIAFIKFSPESINYYLKAYSPSFFQNTEYLIPDLHPDLLSGCVKGQLMQSLATTSCRNWWWQHSLFGPLTTPPLYPLATHPCGTHRIQLSLLCIYFLLSSLLCPLHESKDMVYLSSLPLPGVPIASLCPAHCKEVAGNVCAKWE